MVQTLSVCADGHLHESATSSDYISNHYEFCHKCGSRLLSTCDNCGSSITIDNDHLSTENIDLPGFCKMCGESFPWTGVIEDSFSRSGNFLKIHDDNVNGQFYPRLIYEMNVCYQVKADQALLVLNRKLIENLLIDILRSRYGTDEIELYYNTDEGMTHGLSTLITNFKDKREDLSKFGTIQQSLFAALNKIKYRGDASAHSIESQIEDAKLEEIGKLSSQTSKLLFKLREEIRTAHRNE